MLRRLLLLFLLLTPLSVLAQTASNQYKHINTAWTAPPMGGNYYPACSFPTISTQCVNGYQETFTAPQNGGSISVPPCTATVTSNCIGLVTTYSWTPGGYLYTGTWNIALATAYLDANGAQQYSATVTSSVTVPNPLGPPSPATGLSVSLAP